MNIVVFLAGVADPKWPLPPFTVSDDAQTLRQSGLQRILSPFDEAALEIALKLRNADVETRICAVVVGDADGDTVLRTVAGFRPDQVLRLHSSELHPWDAGRLGRELGSAARRCLQEAELIVVGREFGDFDNGTLAPCMAEQLGRQFVGLIQDARFGNGKLELMRQTGNGEEWIVIDSPVLVSVTNDRRNRLRHPLLKNVTAAKRMTFEGISPDDAGPGRDVSLVSAMPAYLSSRTRPCRMLAGPLEQQAAEVAAVLHRDTMT